MPTPQLTCLLMGDESLLIQCAETLRSRGHVIAAVVTDDDFINAFGKFQGVRPFLALRYHGYQFGEYNPYLGDGRGFLYGQVRGNDGQLYDFGTKGSLT